MGWYILVTNEHWHGDEKKRVNVVEWDEVKKPINKEIGRLRSDIEENYLQKSQFNPDKISKDTIDGFHKNLGFAAKDGFNEIFRRIARLEHIADKHADWLRQLHTIILGDDPNHQALTKRRELIDHHGLPLATMCDQATGIEERLRQCLLDGSWKQAFLQVIDEKLRVLAAQTEASVAKGQVTEKNLRSRIGELKALHDEIAEHLKQPSAEFLQTLTRKVEKTTASHQQELDKTLAANRAKGLDAFAQDLHLAATNIYWT